MADAISALQHVWDAGRFGREADAPGVTLGQRRGLVIAQLCHWPDRTNAFATMVADLLALRVPAANRASVSDTVSLLSVGPETYWAVAASSEPLAGLRARLDSDTGTVAELSCARCALRVSGPATRQVLAKGLPIDLHPRAMPVDAVASSAVHGIGVVVHRSAEDTFDLYLLRSFAVSFWEWLTDAAAEFGYSVDAS